ncbi:hypothetical protein BDR03DRAFT_1020030, partial [Suillus americanus]
MYQTQQVILKHIKKWPRISQTSTSNSDAATCSNSTATVQHDDFDVDPPYDGHHADEEQGRAPAHVAAQPLIRDFNFRPIVLPDVRVPGSDQDQEDRPSHVPRAFQERPGVRLAYLNAVVGNVFGNNT